MRARVPTLLRRVPGPVRFAAAVDAGVGATFLLASAAGVPRGRPGTMLVVAEAALWCAVVLAWCFPAFWAGWQALTARLFSVETGTAEPLPVRACQRFTLGALTAYAALTTLHVAVGGSGGVAFRSVVNTFGLSVGVGAAALAVVHDVRWMRSATAGRD